MRGHLVQGPSLACQFGDLTGGGTFPAPSLPTHWPPLLLTPDHASHFPHLHPYIQEACPAMLSPHPTWGESGACRGG